MITFYNIIITIIIIAIYCTFIIAIINTTFFVAVIIIFISVIVPVNVLLSRILSLLLLTNSSIIINAVNSEHPHAHNSTNTQHTAKEKAVQHTKVACTSDSMNL